MEFFVALLEGIAPALIEGLLNWLLHSASAGSRTAGAVVAFFSFLVFGAVLGGFSLLLFSAPVLSSLPMQVTALVAATGAAGLTAAAFGAWRSRRGKALLRVDRFVYGAALGFGYGLIRFVAA